MSSGTGIARAARDAGLGDISAAQVAALEEAGDATAARIMETARRAFAAALVSIVDVFNPQRVIVGGGIALGQGDRLLQPARDAVERLSFRRQAARVEIVPAQLGDDVGLIGALSLVRLARLGEDRDLH
jgi:glucokinase